MYRSVAMRGVAEDQRARLGAVSQALIAGTARQRPPRGRGWEGFREPTDPSPNPSRKSMAADNNATTGLSAETSAETSTDASSDPHLQHESV